MNHVGLGAKGNIIVSDDIEPGWAMMLEELQDHGVTEKMIKNESDFVDGFWAGVKAASPKDSKLGLELEIRTSSYTTSSSSHCPHYRSEPSPPPPPPKTRRVVKRKPVTQFA